MRATLVSCPIALLASIHLLSAQGTVPTFNYEAGPNYSILGGDLRRGTTTTIPTVLAPIKLAFDAKKSGGKPFTMDASVDVPRILASPIFVDFPFPGGRTQYVDALLRGTFANAGGHTLLARPSVKPITIGIPAGNGYVLTSKRSGRSFAIADLEYVQREIFKQVPHQDGSLGRRRHPQHGVLCARRCDRVLRLGHARRGHDQW
jgi:chitinase